MAPIDSPTPPPEGPSRAQIEAQLARLLASDAFGGASRSQEFLRFVVEEAMAGRQDRLGGYTLGVEIFGRAEDFDPQTDPIVRVEASRLRRRLEHHYLTEGTEDAVLIEVPKGGYVPEFFHRPVAPEPSSPTVEPQRVDVDPPQRRPSLALVALGLVLLAGLVLSLWWVAQSSLPPRPDEASGQAQTEALTVVVLPFDYTADSDLHPFLADGFVEELVSSLAALPIVEVIAPSSARKVATKELTPGEIGQVLQADHVIRGDVRQERDRIRLTVSVVETSSGIVRLSKTYDEGLDNILDLQAEIARDIASSLATEITPTFEHQLTENLTRDSEVLALYHQAAALRDPPSDAVRSRLAEDAYRHIIELDPEFAGGYAGLAYVLAFRSWWGLSEEPATDAQEALEAARMAIEKDPNFAWAQTSLSIASSIVGNYEGSLEAAARASKLSPGDPYILAFSAMTTAFAGEIEAAVPLVRSAIRLDPLTARTPFRNIAGVIYFHSGRYDEALAVLSENVRMGGPDGPHMAFYRAATLARLGRDEEAQRELEKADDFPYGFDVRQLVRAFRDPRETEELLSSLQSVGFTFD